MPIAGAIAPASPIFTGLTRLPMKTSRDHLAPARFSGPDQCRRTPVNCILFVAAVVMFLVLPSMLGVREQEASQLLTNASVLPNIRIFAGRDDSAPFAPPRACGQKADR
jgi:amino acid transporter